MSILHRNSDPALGYSERLQRGLITSPNGPVKFDMTKVERVSNASPATDLGSEAVGQVIELPQPTPDNDPTPDGSNPDDHQLTA